ncbi:MAG: hypothetical protein R6V13_01270 [Anaerolineae bacterium]
MNAPLMTCPYCGGSVPQDTTVCPDCHEDLSALARIEHAHEIHYNKALSLARQGELDKARDQVLMALGFREDFSPAYVLLAKIYARQGAWTEAKESVAEALALAPADEGVQELAERIRRQAARQTAVEKERAVQRRQNAQRLLEAYQRDVAGAFVAGLGLAAVAMTLVSWLFGEGEEEVES